MNVRINEPGSDEGTLKIHDGIHDIPVDVCTGIIANPSNVRAV
jgi:hypothetical protein